MNRASADRGAGTSRAATVGKIAKTGRIEKIGDLVAARLAALDERVEQELGRRATASGPFGDFVLDAAREAWSAGATLARSVATSRGRAGLLSSLVAGPAVDDLGIDAAMAETVREIVRPLARRWLALRESRSAALPPTGGVLILLNRSAWPLPLEALVLWAFLCDGRVGERRMAVLWDQDLPELPFVGDFLRRVGVAAATPENALALLERGAVVLAFPEGSAARTRTYDRRYRLARFADAALLGAAVEAGARIVPGAVVGIEESYPLLGHLGPLPLTAQFPLLGAAGVLPLPVAWSLRLGAAVEYAAGGDGAPAVDAIADAVRGRIAALLGELLAERRSIVGG